MTSWLWLCSVIGFAFAMSGTPGPNNTLVFASGARFGFKRSIPHILGIVVGFPVLLMVIAFGLSAPLRAFPWLFVVMRWCGAAYLLWLAWHIASEPVADTRDGTAGSGTREPMSFISAALFQWVNPKAWIIASGAVVAYTHAATIVTQTLEIAIVFLCVNPIAVGVWTFLGASSRRFITNAKAQRTFQYAMALLLVVSLVPMLCE